jgi:hypothetical protein
MSAEDYEVRWIGGQAVVAMPAAGTPAVEPSPPEAGGY